MSRASSLPCGNGCSSWKAALTIIPVAAPVFYALYMNWTISRQTTSNTGRLPADQATSRSKRWPPEPPKSLPEEIEQDSSKWIVAYERVVSRPISPDCLILPPMQSTSSNNSPSPLFKSYIQATQKAFSWTPQAFLIRSLIREPEIRATFDAKSIERLDFKRDDVVNGVYRVSHYEQDQRTGAERVELMIQAPASYKGPAVRGLILSTIEYPSKHENLDEAIEDDDIVFVNETWMWRLTEEKPTMLESRTGSWFHSLLAGWLILKGIAAVKTSTNKTPNKSE